VLCLRGWTRQPLGAMSSRGVVQRAREAKIWWPLTFLFLAVPLPVPVFLNFKGDPP
jgi:hypothetical protein